MTDPDGPKIYGSGSSTLLLMSKFNILWFKRLTRIRIRISLTPDLNPIEIKSCCWKLIETTLRFIYGKCWLLINKSILLVSGTLLGETMRTPPHTALSPRPRWQWRSRLLVSIFKFALLAVFRFREYRDVFLRIRIRRFVPLGYGSCSFLQWLSTKNKVF